MTKPNGPHRGEPRGVHALAVSVLCGALLGSLLGGCGDDADRTPGVVAGSGGTAASGADGGTAAFGGSGAFDAGHIPCASSSTPGYGAAGGGGPGDGPRPPHHVIVAQGPTDPLAAYALVSWDRSDPTATGYEVLRDGEVIASIEVQDDAWDDTCFLDSSATAGSHSYAVRAVAGGSAGEPSASYELLLRADADFGAVHEVDSFDGADDSDRIEAAIAAAAAAGGGVVQLSARTYSLSRGIEVAGNRIVLRGAGIEQTFLQPAYPGVEGDSACSGTERIVLFDHELSDLGALSSAPIAPGDRIVVVTSSAALAVGQVILLSETHPEQQPEEFEAQGVVQDPGTGTDQRYPYEHNEIVAIDGSSVTFKYPFSYGFSAATVWQRYDRGLHNGIESLTIQGRSADEQTWYDGLTLRGADVQAADVRVRWTNRRLAQLGGHDLRLVGFQGPYGGPRGAEDGICRYKVQIHKTTNALVVGATMGMSADDRNMSLITIQQTVRIVVRNSIFQRSLTYGVNEHGEGSKHLLVENNYFSVGSPDRAAILLGNNTWGFSGPMIIRNNTFENNYRDIRVAQNSYEVRVLDNVSRGNGLQFVRGFGWAGPDTAPDLYGSLRLTIARNHVSTGTNGLYLGTDDGVYPHPGVRDVVVFENHFDVEADAIELNGDSSTTARFQVWDNTGSADYTKPDFVAGDYWQGNADGESYGSPTTVPWTVESFEWEQYDRN